ncbi:MAG: FkbM family methyltransferase, partial [Myxococcaceae bacterium]
MESPWLNLTKQIVRRLPVARYRAMNWVSSYAPARVFLAPFPGQHGAALRFECDLRNTLAREVYFTGQYEPQETCLVRAILKPGDTFVDVGAHWGYFSILASTLIGGSGKVLAIEADPRIHRTLARNVEINGLAKVKALHVAAGEG